MKKFVAILMSVSLGAVLCLSNAGCPKTADKDKVKPPPPVPSDGKAPVADVPKEKPAPAKDKIEPAKDKLEQPKNTPAPKDNAEPAKDKNDKGKNGAFLPRHGLPRTAAEMHRRPQVSVVSAVDSSSRRG